jgi:excisionase family DNA binding protein
MAPAHARRGRRVIGRGSTRSRASAEHGAEAMEESTDRGAHASSNNAETCEVRRNAARETRRAGLPRVAYSVAEVCWLTSLCRTSVYARIEDESLIARKCRNRTIILAEELRSSIITPSATHEPDLEPCADLCLSDEEVCQVTGIGRTTIRKVIDAKSLPSTLLGRRRIVRWADLLAWLKSLPRAGRKPTGIDSKRPIA